MNIILGAAGVVLTLVVLSVILKWFRFRALPGPGLLQYFPGGEVFPMLRDSRTSLKTLLALSKKYGDVFHFWAGPTQCIVSAVPADVAQILSSTDDFPRPRGMDALFDVVVPGGLITMPKDLHLIARRKLRENFNYTLLRNVHSEMVYAVDELCAILEDGVCRPSAGGAANIVNISEHLYTVTFRIITNVAFGSKMTKEERMDFSKTATTLIDEMLMDFMGYPIRQALTVFGIRKGLFESKKKIDIVCHQFIKKRLEETIEERKNRPEDVLDVILTLDQNDIVTVTSHAVEFAVAGSHTTAQMLAWCIYEICCNARVAAELDKEITEKFAGRSRDEPVTPEDLDGLVYSRKIWKEACRKHPAVSFFMRLAARDVTLSGSGVVLPKGTNVLAFTHRAQTHPDTWSEPDTFKPERWGSGSERREGDMVPPGANVPFSLGARSCVGRFLADYEGVLILVELYRRFKFMLACDPSEIVTSSGWVESPRYVGNQGRDFGIGVPVRIELRS